MSMQNRSTVLFVAVVGLALTISGCSKGTAVGGSIGNGASAAAASGGANAFDAASASPPPTSVATGFGASTPTAAATAAAKTTAPAAVKTTAAAKKTTAAAPTAVKTTAAPKKTTAAPKTAKATESAAAVAGASAATSNKPFQIGIYADGTSGHTPLDPTNAEVYGGTSVVFTNYDTVARSVQSSAGEFTSPSIPPMGTWTYVAETSADETINYQDSTRPYDNGQISVVQP